MRFSRRPVEDIGLLRMTNWVDEIATSFNQKTVDLLAMTDLDRYFHPHLVLLSSMRVYPENTLMLKNAVILSSLLLFLPLAPSRPLPLSI